MNGERESGEDRFRQVVYGLTAATTLAYGGWLGLQVTKISADLTERLTRIETTMAENRAERSVQIEDLRRRVDRLETRAYREDRNER